MRRLLFLSLFLVLAGLCVSACGDSDDTGSELPEEAAQLLDDYRNSWVNQDVDAFYAYTTEDFFFREYYYGTESHALWKDWVVEREGTPSKAANAMEFGDPIELIEVRDVVVSGDGPWTVTANEIWEEDHGSYAFRWDGNFTRTIVDDAGTMKIASAIFAGGITEVEN